MKKVIMITIGLIFVLCLSANAEILYKLTFDNAVEGSSPATYTPGVDEVVTNLQSITMINNGGNNPVFQSTLSVLANPFQGGKALVTDSDGKDEGYFVDFNPAFAPGDLTVEYIFMVRTLSVPGNTAGLQYLGSTEWPSGQSFQWMLRIIDNKLNFWTNRGDSNAEYVRTLSDLAINTWYHVAAVLDYNESTPASSQIQMYLNGVSQGTSTYNATANSFSLGGSGSNATYSPEHAFTAGYNYALGANISDHRGLAGAIDALAISNTALAPGSFVLPHLSSEENWHLY